MINVLIREETQKQRQKEDRHVMTEGEIGVIHLQVRNTNCWQPSEIRKRQGQVLWSLKRAHGLVNNWVVREIVREPISGILSHPVHCAVLQQPQQTMSFGKFVSGPTFMYLFLNDPPTPPDDSGSQGFALLKSEGWIVKKSLPFSWWQIVFVCMEEESRNLSLCWKSITIYISVPLRKALPGILP